MKTITFFLLLLSLLIPNANSYAGKALVDSPAISKVLSGWEAMTTGSTQLDKKTAELIAIAVAVQLRCNFCVQQHAKTARQLGVTDAQIKYAFGVAGYVRMLNATLHQLDDGSNTFSAEIK